MKKVILIVLLSFAHLFAFEYDIELSQQQLQEKIEKKFPYEKKKLLTKTTLSNPKVMLKDGSEKVYMNSDVTFNAPGDISLKAYVEFNGKVIYDNEKKEFYLQNLEIEQLNFDKIPAKFHNTIKSTLEAILPIILNQYPIYTLKENTLKKTATALLLKNIKVENNLMIITLGF